MMTMRHPFTTIVILLLTISCSAETIKSYKLHHDIGAGWVEKGVINIAQNLTMTYEPTITQIMEGSDEEVSADLLGIKWYKIKASEDDGGKSVMTSVPFCLMRRANFREEISLMLGTYDGELISVSLTPLISPLAPKSCDELPLVSPKPFMTKVKYDSAIPGMKIPMVLPEQNLPPGYIPLRTPGSKNPLLDAEKVGSKQEGFFSKYWYIIVPLMIFSLFGGQEPPADQPSGSGGSSNSAGPKRRDKRF